MLRAYICIRLASKKFKPNIKCKIRYLTLYTVIRYMNTDCSCHEIESWRRGTCWTSQIRTRTLCAVPVFTDITAKFTSFGLSSNHPFTNALPGVAPYIELYSVQALLTLLTHVTKDTTVANMHSSVTFSFWVAVGNWCSSVILALKLRDRAAIHQQINNQRLVKKKMFMQMKPHYMASSN